MSALVVDLGNSRWKMARAETEGIGRVITGSYDGLAGIGNAAIELVPEPGRVLLASVAETAKTQRIIDILHRDAGFVVTRLNSTDRMPNVRSGYQKPDQLGIDRLLAMVAARAESQGALCVVDAGTAVTVDFVDRHGQHLGGFILPGMKMFRDCLLANTSIPRDDVVDEQATMGRDTPTAVALGARYAVAGLVERLTIGSAALFPGQTPSIFVGGGDAECYADLLPQPCRKLDHLVLRGLAVAASAGDC